MTRIALILLLGFSMLVSFSVQADGRGGHKAKHHSGHHNKHQRHYYSHAPGRYYQPHGSHRYGYGHNSHYSYGGYPGAYRGFYVVPHVALSAGYGFPAGGGVVVHASYP